MKNSNVAQGLSWPLAEVISGKWDQHYELDKNAPLYFKLLDNSKIIKKIQHNLKSDEELLHLYKYQLNFTHELEKLNVWVKSEGNIIKMNVLDIYASFLKFMKDKSFEDQLFNSNEVSFIGALGPFKHMALVDCLNENVLNKYLFTQIISNKLPTRRLRIYTSGDIKIEHGNDYGKKDIIQIKQITDSGILFSTHNDLLLNSLDKSDLVKFFIDTRLMKDFLENNFCLAKNRKDDFFLTDDDLRYFFIDQTNIVKSLSYQSSKTNEIFLFCRYQHMLESDVPSVFYELIQKVGEYFKSLT